MSSEHATDFEERIQEVRLQGSTVGRERTLAAVGVVLLVAAIGIGVWAFYLSRDAAGAVADAQQRDAIIVALIGVSVSVLGLALFLRYSLGGLLRLWLARLVAEQERTDRERTLSS